MDLIIIVVNAIYNSNTRSRIKKPSILYHKFTFFETSIQERTCLAYRKWDDKNIQKLQKKTSDTNGLIGLMGKLDCSWSSLLSSRVFILFRTLELLCRIEIH